MFNMKEYKKRYYQENKEKISKWYQENKDKIRSNHKDYYQNNIEKLCAYSREYHKNHRQEYRKNQIKNRYNLSHEDWLKIWENQNGKCAICEMPFLKPSNSCVDHNHKTGKIRGLLCNKCNLGIGLFGDELELIIKVMNYLSRR